MSQDFNCMTGRDLNAHFRKLSKEANVVENLYKTSISERLRVKLEMIDLIECRKCLPDQSRRSGVFGIERIQQEKYLSDLDLNNLVAEHGNLIDLDGSSVNFCTNYYGNINTDAPPQSINPRRIFTLIKDRTNKNVDWLEVVSKLLPFMKKHSHLYAKLLGEMFSVEVEQEMRADYREGAEHMNSLLSEYGEDIFPD
jgi:hypothetical protein